MSEHTAVQQTTVSGHFGEWLQGRQGPDGPVVLVTVRCPVLCAHVPGQGLHLAEMLDAQQLEAFCKAMGMRPQSLPDLSCDMPLGAGAGASTASLLAVARAVGYVADPEALAALCITIEGASDPLMYDAPDRLLWASRQGRVLGHMAAPPMCEILGGYWGATERTVAGDAAFPDVSDLIDTWRAAVAARDVAGVARVASASAERCAEMRGPADPMPDLVRDIGALGHLRAHTGSARGLIFAPGQIPATADAMLREAGLRDILRFRTGDDT